MSIASPPSRINNAASGEARGGKSVPNGNRVDQIINQRLDETCRTLWRAELTRRTLGLLICVNFITLVWLVIDQWIYSPGIILRTIAFSSSLAIICAYVWKYLVPIFKSSIAPEYAARAIDCDLTGARQSLLSYLTLREASRDDSLQGGVVRSIGAESGKKLLHHDAPPSEAIGTVRWWIIAIVSVTLLAIYIALSPKSSVQAITRLGAPLANIAAPQRVRIDQVTPGNARVTAGVPVKISASVDGLFTNESVTCVWSASGNEERLALSLDATSDQYVGEIPIPHFSSGTISYQITAGDASAGPFELTIEDLPVVTIDRIDYQPPPYTRLQNFSKSVAAIRAVDGTKVTIHAKVNRAVSRAKIEFNPASIGAQIQATAGALEMNIDPSGTALSTSFNLRNTLKLGGNKNKNSYRIVVWDAIEQENVKPIVYPIEIVPDLPPEINITVPSQTPKDLPYNAQQLVEIHASDPDFGLSRIELEVRYGSNRKLVPTLWENVAGELGRQIGSILIRPEEFDLQIGDSIELVGIATDNRSDLDSDLFKPNIVRTDAIQLRITSPSSLPAADDPAADGVSDPQDSSESGSKLSQTDESGGSGSGGSGDSQATSQQNGSGEGENGSSSQSSNSDNASSDESSGSGSSNGGEENQNPNTDDPSNRGSMPSGDADGSSDPSDSEASSNNGESSEGDNPSETSSDQSNQPDPDNSQGASEENDPTDSASSSSTANQNPLGSNSNQQSSGVNQREIEGSTNGESESGDSQSMSDDQTKLNTPRPNDSATSPSDPSANPTQNKPSHDGEAFERIRDYLDQLQRSENSDRDPSSAKGTPDQQPSPSENSQSDNGNQTESSGGSEGTASLNDSDGGTKGSSGEDSAEATNGNDGSEASKGNADTNNGASENGSDSQNSTEASDSEKSENATDTGAPQPEGGQSESSSEEGDGRIGQQQEESGLSDQANQTPQESDGDTSNDSSSQSEGTGQSLMDSADQNSNADDSQNQDNQQRSGNPAADSENTASSTPDTSKSPNNQASSDSSTSSPAMGEEVFGDGSVENPQPPDEVNLDYAKQATDLVLDYLESTRDRPNQELLERLQWSEEELNAFVERWRSVRDLPTTKGKQGREEFEETLRSLGLRDPKSTTMEQGESSDDLRGISDSGNTQQVPAAYRDAFNAFRRAMNRVE